MTGLVGRTLDRYEIGNLLGAGGMGSVYRARDIHLKRDVAIKVLSDRGQDDPHRQERFNREIRTVAQLSHPNILEIHDFGQSDGISYAVMELLKGRNLRQLIWKRPLPVDRALEIGISVAEGLGAAHHQGVLHRDIKPENIFVTTDGTVKILDFGLARHVALSEPTAETESIESSLTTPGTVVGTTAYMSPEQVRGQELDPRSDIFSLGCVLYEMFTGTHPFRRETRADTMSAILNDKPQLISQSRSDIPPAVDLIIDRCLKKDSKDRFESARDVAFALGAMSQSQSGQQAVVKDVVPLPKSAFRWVAVAAVMVAVIVGVVLGVRSLSPPDLPDSLRITVMPFETVNADTNLQEFAAGLAKTITDDLILLQQDAGSIDWVAPQESLKQVAGQGIRDIYRYFNSTIAVTGRLQRAGERVQLTLAAISPSDQKRLRTATIDETLGNAYSFQQQPALRIAEMLDVEVPTKTLDRLSAGATTMPSVFGAFLRSQGLLAHAQDETQIASAEALLIEALAQDPLFQVGHVALANAYRTRFNITEDEQWLEMGMDRGNRAIELEGRTDAAWLAIGELSRAAGRPLDAVAAFNHALKLNPSNPEACLARGSVYQDLRDFGAAEADYQRSVYLRPGYWPDHDRLAKLYLATGKYEAAATQFRHVIECAPDYALGYVKLGGTSMYLGRTEAARKMFERSLELEPTYWALSNLGTLYFEASRFSDAAQMFEKALEIDPNNHAVLGNLANAYRFGAQPERAEATFRLAAEAAEALRATEPDDLALTTQLAGYHAMLGERTRGMELLAQVIAARPTDPQIIAWIAETLEDLEERERALEWVRRALESGIPRSRFEGRPTLRELVADERYQALVEKSGGTM
jgi:serine/threonine-protein kinase